MSHPPDNPTAPRWTPDRYSHHAAFVPELGIGVVDLLDPRPGERILDLGCGDGTLTAQIAARGATVVGIDAAPPFVEATRARGLDARLVNAERLPFDREFDAVFSNAAIHWMRDHDAVVAGVAGALKPGGRFVGEFGGHGNVAAIRVAIAAALGRRGLAVESPWYFPTAGEYRRALERGGFTIEHLVLFARPTPLPTGMGGWLDLFAEGILRRVPQDARESARDEIVELLRPVLCDSDGQWTADYVRLRFAARRVQS